MENEHHVMDNETTTKRKCVEGNNCRFGPNGLRKYFQFLLIITKIPYYVYFAFCFQKFLSAMMKTLIYL